MTVTLLKVADWLSHQTGGRYYLDASANAPATSIPHVGRYAYAAKSALGTEDSPSVGLGVAVGDWIHTQSGGLYALGSEPDAMPLSSQVNAGGQGSLVYAANQKSDAEQETPDGWPDGWDFPGPPWPPGWPKDVPEDSACTVTLEATQFIHDPVGVVANLFNVNGNPESIFDGEVLAIVAEVDGVTVNLKKAVGDTFEEVVYYQISKHDGTNYGIDEDLYADLDDTHEGGVLTVSALTVSTNPVITGEDTSDVDAVEFIAIADGGTIPTGWAINTDLAGHYIRGAAAVDLTSMGAKTDDHTWANGATDSVTHTHVVGEHTPNTTTEIQSAGGTPHSGHVIANLAHTHVVQATSDPASHLPPSRVIDWVGKKIAAVELDQYPKGTIFGFSGAVANVPAGWTHDTTLNSKFAITGTTAGTTGADTHEHTEEAGATADAGGDHAHGGSVGSTAGTVLASASIEGGPAYTVAAHTNSIAASGTHPHTMDTSLAGDSQSNLPPYKELPYIRKTADAVQATADDVSSGLHVFVDPSVTLVAPAGWTFTHNVASSKNLVGRSAGDADFGTYGNIGAATHAHDLTVTIVATVDHQHTATSQDFGGEGGATAVVVSHEHTTTAGGGHGHTADWDSDAVSNVPASKNLRVLKKK